MTEYSTSSPNPIGSGLAQASPGRGTVLAESPARLFLFTVGAVILCEFTVMTLIETFLNLGGREETLLNSVLLAVVVAPVLYLLVQRPLALAVRERQRAEAALRDVGVELEHRVRDRTEEVSLQADLLDAVDHAVIATDLQGTIRYWNRGAATLYGWRSDQAVGRNAKELRVSAVTECQLQEPMGQIREGRSWAGEFMGLHRDGRSFPASVVCSPLRDREDRVTGLVTVSSDISHRKQAEEALRYSEAKYSNLVENSLAGVLIYRAGKLAFVNQRLADLAGYSKEELLSLDPAQLVHPEDRPMLLDKARRRLAGETMPPESEVRVLSKSGDVRWVHLQGALTAHRGQPAIFGYVVDITQRKLAEAALERSEKDLRELSARLLRAQEEERARIARELHDGIGQSLSAVKFVLENATQSRVGCEECSALARVDALVPRLQDAVEEVRRISMALRPSMLDDLGLLATLGWFCREFEAAYPGITVHREIGVDEKAIPEYHKTVIYRLVQEALNNVAKHSRATSVRLQLTNQAGRLCLSVADNGRGFEASVAAGSRESGAYGLRSMRERAQLSGGSFGICSEPGGGTAIQAVWPLAELAELDRGAIGAEHPD